MKIPKILTKQVKEYINVRSEQIGNITHLAAEINLKFDLGYDKNLESLRKTVSYYLLSEKKKKNLAPIRRLFFDLETSYYLVPMFKGQMKSSRWTSPDHVLRDSKIICVCYKWQYEDKVHTIKWDKNQDDAELVKELIKVIAQADEVVAHNGDRFDIKELRTRAVLTGNLMFPTYRTLDTLKKSRQYFNFPSNRLDYLGKALQVGRKLDHQGMSLWVDVIEHKSKSAMKTMVDYCKQDVILLEDVYTAMAPYIYHNTNFAVIKGGEKWHCPECASENVKLSHTDATPMGYIKRHMKCVDCTKYFRISNRTYLRMLETEMRK